MTYEEFLNEAARVAMLHQEWRWGQTLYNVLLCTRPELTVHLNPTEAGSPDEVSDIDPFYDDAKVPAFLAWLEGVWQG